MSEINRLRLSRRQVLICAGVAGASGLFLGKPGARSWAATAIPRNVGPLLQKSFIWSTADFALAPPVSTPPGPVLWEAIPQSPHFTAFRKRFTLSAQPRTATLHLFADVRYMLWVNGQYVTRGPARFHPKGPEYDSIPVGEYLQAGGNTIAVLVMAKATNGKMMLHVPGLTALLQTDDSGAVAAATDTTWKWNTKTRYGTPRMEWGNVRDRVDASVEDGDWTLADYDDSGWSTAISVDGAPWGPLTPRRIPLLRETLLPAAFAAGQTLPTTLIAGQEISFDLGRTAQAYTALDLEAEPGTKLTLTHAGITYTARAGRQTYLSSDTHHFQTGRLRVTAGQITLHEFHAVERLYPFDIAGSFQSSDPVLDDIWAMCARSVQLLSEDSYVDCADRERTEWMDDDPPAFDITRTALAGPGPNGTKVYADPRLLEEMLRRTALTHQPDGWVKAHTCSDRFDIHAYMEDRSCDWVQGARRYYESTQNIEPIREIWPVIVTQMDWFLSHRTTRGLVRAREWVVWGNPMGYQTCEGLGLNAFVYQALVDAAYLGGVVGDKAQATRYAQMAQALASAVNSVLWDETHGTYFSGYFADGDTNTSKLTVTNGLAEPTMFPALWALDQGIVPEARRVRVTKYLLANRGQATRLMTYYYLFRQFYAAQDAALDREVLDTLRTKWKAMAQTGWKTSWEELNNSDSKAHIYGSFPGYFLSAYVLGVRRDDPVWKRHLVIEPRLADLASAEGSVVTEFGPVPVGWKRQPGRLDFQITVPTGVTADVRLPVSGTRPQVTVNGKLASPTPQGTYLALTLASGPHTGSLTFVLIPSH